MTLTYKNLSKAINFESGKIQLLCIENPKFLQEFLQDLIDGENFLLGIGEDMFSDGKFISINTDIMHLDLSQRKITNAIFAKIKELAMKDLYQESCEILEILREFSSKIINLLDFPLTADEIELDAVLKSLNITVCKSDSLLERVLDLMLLEREFLNVKLFVFFGLKTLLSESEILLLYKEIRLRGLNVLLVEAFCSGKLEDESLIIIDKDFCEIRSE